MNKSTIFILFLIILQPITAYEIHYDNNGNIIQDDKSTYEYNDLNQLTKVNNIEEYLYDSEGNRVAKIEGDQTTYYVGENLVRIINSSGTFDTIYYYQDSVLVGRKDPDQKKYYYHPDHLG